MNKWIKKTTASLLAVFMLLGVGCKNNIDNSPSDSTVDTVERVEMEGVHDFSYSETDIDFIKDGQTEYVLVTPAYPDADETSAKEEFINIIKKAVKGINIRTVYDTGLSHTADAKYISIGRTTLLESSGIKIDEVELGMDGYRIVTKDNTIYICGGASSGTCYGVYGFMNLYFDFETFWADCETINECKNVKLWDFNVTDIPDIAYRAYAGSYYYEFELSTNPDEKYFSKRLRFEHQDDDYMLPIYKEIGNTSKGNKVFHNSLYYAPIDVYAETHPKWYSDNGSMSESEAQLCYTAHGDEKEFEALIELCAQKAMYSYSLYTPEKYPYANIVTITIGDNANHCSCSACADLFARTGSDAGAIVIFVNKMAERVKELMALEENKAFRRDDFKILFFAYNGAELAPAKWDETLKKYVPIIPEVVLNEHVGVYCVAASIFDYQSDIYASSNETGKETLRAWADLTDDIYYWTYSTNFRGYMYYYDSITFYSNAYKFLAAEGGAKYIYNQQQSNQRGTAVAFGNFKSWLDSKLMWDSNADVSELTDMYFDAMYGDAATVMKELHTEMRMHTIKLCLEEGWYAPRSPWLTLDRNANWWPAKTVLQWLDKLDKAYSVIEKYKTSEPALYESLYLHISQEFLAPAYTMLKNQNNALSPQAYAELVKKFKEACELTGCQRDSEYSTLEEFIKGL